MHYMLEIRKLNIDLVALQTLIRGLFNIRSAGFFSFLLIEAVGGYSAYVH
jgi:hypothetical protein